MQEERKPCPVCGGPFVGVWNSHKAMFRKEDACGGWRTAYHGPLGHFVIVPDKRGIERSIPGHKLCGDCAATWSRAVWKAEKPLPAWYEEPMRDIEREALGYLSEGFTQENAAKMVGMSQQWMSSLVVRQRKKYTQTRILSGNTGKLWIVHNRGARYVP